MSKRTISLRRSTSDGSYGFLEGECTFGVVTSAELRQMASPEWAAECTRLANEIEGPAKTALREATRDSERASERLRAAAAARELEPQIKRSTVPQKRDKS